MVRNYNNENFKDLKGIYLIDFYADWCGPCKMLSPILDELDIDVIKVNVDLNEEIAKEYKVMSIPNLFLIKDGEVVKQMIGFHSKDEIVKEIDLIKD